MPAPFTPTNLVVQTGNRQVAVSWNLSAGATSYFVQRSIDSVIYSVVGVSYLNNYTDPDVSIGTLYYYQVAASNVPIGKLILESNPIAGETYSIANVTFTARTSGATGNEFNIGVDAADTAQHIFATANQSFSLAGIVNAVLVDSTVVFIAKQQGAPGTQQQLSTSLTGSSIIAFSPFVGTVLGDVSYYSPPQSVIPTPTGEMSLLGIRNAAKERADMVNSQFIAEQEWNTFINLALYELYDLLITTYNDYFMAPRAKFVTGGNRFVYPLPNGVDTYSDVNGISFVAEPFYKLLGVDLALNTANNAFVTLNRYNLVDRNKFLYPNTASTIYGVFNMQYRVLGTNIEFIPTPSANQTIQLLYIPRLPEMIRDTDITTIGFSGWLNYVIVRAAKYALNKEESDSSQLDQELLYIKTRIEETAPARDAGMPDTISDVQRGTNSWGQGNSGYGRGGT